MIQQEKSGDYGAAIRGDEKTAAWATEGDLGGTPAGRDTPDGANKVALTVGGVLIVALILICFRLAFDGVKKAADTKGFTGAAYLNGETSAPTVPNPGAPAGVSSQRSARQAAPLVNLPAPAPPNVPIAVASTHNLFVSEEEREKITGLLDDCRAAYEASGELSQKGMGSATQTKPTATRVGLTQTTLANEDSTPTPPPGMLTAKEWDSIDTQIDAISATIGLATQPARYPIALQDTTEEIAHEMRTYLQTTRIAIAQTDSAKRSAIQARADAHRQKAGQLLSILESAIASGTVPNSSTNAQLR